MSSLYRTLFNKEVTCKTVVLLLKSLIIMSTPPNFLPILSCVSDVLYVANTCAVLYLEKDLEKTSSQESNYLTRSQLEKIETTRSLQENIDLYIEEDLHTQLRSGIYDSKV